MFDFVKFGKGIRFFRTKNEMTQEKLAEMVEVNELYLNRIENARVKPSLELMVRLCNVFNISVNDCLRYKDYDGNVLYKQFKSSLNLLDTDEKQFIAKSIHSMIKF